MLTRENFKGLYVLIITPMDEKLRVNFDGHRENIRKLVSLGVDGVILNGTNGEFHTTTDEEKDQLLEILIEEGKGKLMCVAGCSAVNTDEAIRRTRRATELGADGVMNVVPYYYPPTKAEAIQYWRDLAEACPDIGLICYNNPYTTQVTFTDQDFAALDNVPNFVGSKMQGGDISAYMNCLRNTNQTHMPLEQLWGVSNLVGGRGVMASFIYGSPEYMMRWWKTISSGDIAESMRMQDEILDYLQKVILPPFLAGANDTAGTKAFVEALGHWHCGKARRPYFPVPQEAIEEIRRQTEEKYPQFLE